VPGPVRSFRIKELGGIHRAGSGRHLELVAIGNAFHRLQRRAVAEAAFRWIAPGGHLALLWSNPPWVGSAAWQRALAETKDYWTRQAQATERVPVSWDQAMAEEPHTAILAAAGFTSVGAFDFSIPHEWTVETLTGRPLSCPARRSGPMFRPSRATCASG
jgi:hypothetical protein